MVWIHWGSVSHAPTHCSLTRCARVWPQKYLESWASKTWLFHMVWAAVTMGSHVHVLQWVGAWHTDAQWIWGLWVVSLKGQDCANKVDHIISCSQSQRLNFSALHKNVWTLTRDVVTWPWLYPGITDSSFPQAIGSFCWSGMMHVLVVPSTLVSRGTEERKAPDPYGLLSFDTGPSHPCIHFGANFLAVIPCLLFAMEN